MDVSAVTVPGIHTWQAGDEFNAERMNEIADALEFMRNPPMIHVARRLTTQSIPINTWTTVQLDYVFNSYDPTGMWNPATPDRVTVTQPGWYTCEMTIAVNGTATDTRLVGGLYKNGFTGTEFMMRYDQTTAPNSGNQVFRKEMTLFFNVGDYARIGIFSDGVALTSQITNDSESSGLRLRWVSN